MSAGEVLDRYESLINEHDFDLLVPLICEEALFWFNDGSFTGIGAIRGAFERTWTGFPLERYWLEDKRWIAASDEAAACTYYFRWTTTIDGKSKSGGGRGTTVLARVDSVWRIVHEHLSQFPG